MIQTKINININKLEEFIRLLVPEAKEDNIKIDLIEDNGEMYEIKTYNNNSEIYFKYKKIHNDFDDQLDVMSRLSLLKLYNKNYKWGGLIGVRPTKLVRKLLKYGYNFNEIKDILENFYLVSREKAELLINIVETELSYLNSEELSVYIGIPFCPTRCTYCSFSAYLKKGKYNDTFHKYLHTLKIEIEEVSKMIKKYNKKISSIYIGGGTPSILNEEELDDLLCVIKSSFDIDRIKEFTFEAGRIDTLNNKKLDILKKYNIKRISINPQSFKESTLKLVNRYHNIEQFDEIYNYAKEKGFIINMDMILGLPEETTEDIINSINNLYKYDIENLTIHYLAIKNASALNKDKYSHNITLSYEKINKEIVKFCKEKNLHPYYMYRQKNSFDFGENVGYSVKGYESIYNIEMIEENQSIIGIGAGSITKIIEETAYTQSIKRYVNPKDPIVYINEFYDRNNTREKALVKLFREEIF